MKLVTEGHWVLTESESHSHRCCSRRRRQARVCPADSRNGCIQAAYTEAPHLCSTMDLSFMDQSVEVTTASNGASPEPEPEPEPEPPQRLIRSWSDAADAEAEAGAAIPRSAAAAVAAGVFTQHDLSSTALVLESAPSRVECVASSSENLDHTVYLFKVHTANGRVWVISRRFSDFEKLKAELTKDGNPGVKAAIFPRKFWNPFRPVSDSVTQERKVELQTWMNEVIELCPGTREVEMFLADDNSLDPTMEAQLVNKNSSESVTTAAAAPLDSISPGGGSGNAGAVEAAVAGRERSGSLPPELIVEGWAEEEAARAAKALEVKEETMDALPMSLEIRDEPVLDGA